jgi:hypothetical protein
MGFLAASPGLVDKRRGRQAVADFLKVYNRSIIIDKLI